MTLWLRAVTAACPWPPTHVRLGRRQAKLHEGNLGLLHAVKARNGMREALVEDHALHQLRVLDRAAKGKRTKGSR